MKMNGQVFSKAEQDLVHKKSIEILENVGISFPDEGVLAMLEQNGASVDWDKQVAKISEAMVRHCFNRTKRIHPGCEKSCP
jgi:trimethylamine:corrinoid methyltransferase-like protein